MARNDHISRYLTWFVALFIAFGVTVPPIALYIVSHSHEAGRLETEAEATAAIISRIVVLNPTMWQFEEARLGEYLSRRPRRDVPESRRILATNREVLAEHVEELPPPVLRRSHALLDAGVVVGELEIARSLRPLVNSAILVHLAVLPFGLGFFILLRTLPLRTLHRAEQFLRESEEGYRTLIESAGDGILIFDAQTEAVIDLNRRAAEMLGAGRGEVLGKRLPDLLGEDDVDVYQRVWRDRMKHGTTSVPDLHFKRADGSLVPVEISSTTMDLWGRRVIQGICRDISERLKAEEELRNAKMEMERQNEELRKLDQLKDGLVREISHELKSPVAKQSMHLEVLRGALEKHGLLGEIDSIVKSMEASVRRQSSAIRNILDLSRLDGGKHLYHLAPVRLDQLVTEVTDFYRQEFQLHRVRLKLNLTPVVVQGDREMLWHVFSNVINNAVKFTRDAASPTVEISLGNVVGEAKAVVRDNGIGLDELDKRNVFQTFYRGASSVDGSGLGLALTKRIVEDLGGRIWLTSDGRDKGTTVGLAFPLLEGG